MTKPRRRILAIDIFSGINVLLFIWMCKEVYYDRFIHYRGIDHLQEFFVYALIILIAIATAWKMLRHCHIPAWLLVMVQIGIVIHFAGGLAIWHESRLYDKVILHIRYDKYVHFVNSFICGWTLYIFYLKSLSQPRWLLELQLVVGVLGLGAVVEIIEYLVTLTAIHNGVGGYDNNMQDMIANLLGSVFCILAIRLKDKVAVKKALPTSTPWSG